MKTNELKLFLRITKKMDKKRKRILFDVVSQELKGIEPDKELIDNLSESEIKVIVKILEKRLLNIDEDIKLYSTIYKKVYC